MLSRPFWLIHQSSLSNVDLLPQLILIRPRLPSDCIAKGVSPVEKHLNVDCQVGVVDRGRKAGEMNVVSVPFRLERRHEIRTFAQASATTWET